MWVIWCGQSGIFSPGCREKNHQRLLSRRGTRRYHQQTHSQVFCGCSYSFFILCSSAVLRNVCHSKIQEVFHLTKSLLHRHTRIPATNKTNVHTVLGAELRLRCPQVHENSPRSASNRREHVTYVYWTGAAVIWGWDKREERLWKWKHRFSLLLHRQSSSGGAPSFQDSLISESQNTCCLPDR